MEKKPVILLAFANDSSNPQQFLKALEGEKIAIKQALIPFQNQGAGIVYEVPSSDPASLFKDLSAFQGQIALFHFAGHANGTDLYLESAEDSPVSLHHENLLHLLAAEKQLSLVFLNGCATAGQVDKLLAAGIPAVIATHHKIPDQKAQAFAETFYLSLMKGNSIAQAFLSAKTMLDPSDEESYMHVRGFEREGLPQEEDLWGLFLADQTAGTWKLPIAPIPKPSKRIYTVMGLVYLLLALVGGFWGLQPRSSVETELEIWADKASFSLAEDSELFYDLALHSLGVSGLQSTQIPADQVELKEAGVLKTASLSQGLSLEAMEEFGTAYLNLTQITLQSLSLPAGLSLSLETPSDSTLNLDFIQGNPPPLRVYSQDTLRLDTRPNPIRVYASRDLAVDYFEGIEAKLYPVQEEFSVFLEAQAATLFMHHESRKELSYSNLKFSRLAFEKLENQKISSSIHRGEIRFMAESKAYDSQVLQAQDKLSLKFVEGQALQVNFLRFSEGHIHLKATGQLEEIIAGAKGESLMPTQLAWIWNQYRIALLLAVLGLIGAFFLLPSLMAFLGSRIRQSSS